MKSRFLRRIALAMLFAPFLATPMSLFAWQKNPDKGSGEPKELSRVVVQKLENVVIPALQSGDEGRFMEAFMEIIQRAETDDFEAIENFGIEFGIPSLKKEFGSRFLNIVEQKTVPQNSSFQLSTVLYLNQHFLDRVDGDLRELDAHPVMNEPLELPADWNANEKLFWEVHVFDNQLANLQQLTAYFVQLNKPFFERATKKKETATIDAIQPVGEVPDRLLAAMAKMNENQAELRLVELELAEKTMRESKDFEERLSAAFAMELDIGRLNEFFEKTPAASITRPKLVNPNVKETIESLIASERQVLASGFNPRITIKTVTLSRGATALGLCLKHAVAPRLLKWKLLNSAKSSGSLARSTTRSCFIERLAVKRKQKKSPAACR